MISLFLLASALQVERKMPERESDQSPSIGNVTSSDSKGGVTAGYIGSLQQNNIMPTLVRGPLLNEFKVRFQDGATAYRLLVQADTDAAVSELCDHLDKWYAATFEWLYVNVSPWAAERFAFQPIRMSMFSVGSNLSQAAAERRTAAVGSIYPVLQNLDQLMREPSIYPAFDPAVAAK